MVGSDIGTDKLQVISVFRFFGFPSKLVGEWTEIVKNVELILVMGCFGTGIPVFGTFSVFRGNRPGNA